MISLTPLILIYIVSMVYIKLHIKNNSVKVDENKTSLGDRSTYGNRIFLVAKLC